MLEQHVVFVCGATDSAKDVAAHEVVGIRAETIDDLSQGGQYHLMSTFRVAGEIIHH